MRGRVKTANRRDTVDEKLEELSAQLVQFECVFLRAVPLGGAALTD